MDSLRLLDHWKFPTTPFGDTLVYLGVTERPLYYGHEYEEDGMSKCKVNMCITEHPLSTGSRVRCIPAIGRELSDTCQIAA